MTTDARAHVSRTSKHVEKSEQARQPRPNCVACGGIGVIHVQVPGELRIERRECQCWRITEAMDAVAADVENRVPPDADYERAKAQGERA